MKKQQFRKKLHHYNTPGHAHELTFSCCHKQPYFNDSIACQMFLDELDRSRTIYDFRIWAYVLMPDHVHLLICPSSDSYDIGKIGSGIKGVMAKRYRQHLLANEPNRCDAFLIRDGNQMRFAFWQPGGGFDRNLWNPEAIHDSIRYIEANPVRKGLRENADDWPWSSAYARSHNHGLLPDIRGLPFQTSDPRKQKLGVV